MAILIAHASISENGTVNGATGDSTGKEVCTRNWYKSNNKDWDFMAIHPDPAVRERHALQAGAACANDSIGYGQSNRNTLNTQAKKVNYNLEQIYSPCNCDCSALQNVLAVASGAPKVTYGINGWTTRNMRKELQAAGYIIITDKKYLQSEDYCVRGAIYVREGAHTICGLGNGSKANETLIAAGLVTAESEFYPAYTGTSTNLDTMLSVVGVPAEYRGNKTNRKPLAEANGISNYNGTITQNITFKKLVKSGKLKKIKTSTSTSTSTSSSSESQTIDKNDTVKVKAGATNYTGKSLKSYVYEREHQVREVKGDRVVITYKGQIVAAVNIKNLILISKG